MTDNLPPESIAAEEIVPVPAAKQRQKLSPLTSPLVVGAVSLGLIFVMCLIIFFLILFSALERSGQ